MTQCEPTQTPDFVGQPLAVEAARHDDVGQNEIGAQVAQPLERLATGSDRLDPDVGLAEGELDDLAHGDAVVRQENGSPHVPPLPRSGRAAVAGCWRGPRR
jgi:hypothetical protein